MTEPQPSPGSASSVMKHMFPSKNSTKDVISRYQESVQGLVDATHQLQRDVRSLKESHHAEHAYQHGANESIQVTLRELNQLSTTSASVRVDLQQIMEDIDEATGGLRDLMFEVLREVRKAPQKQVARRRRRVGLIEGVFRGLDQLLLQGFVRLSNAHQHGDI